MGGETAEFFDQKFHDVYPAFRFTVEISGFTGIFAECTLPSVEWDIEEVKEGGLNSYTHQLPGLRKTTNRIILKNGYISARESFFVTWYASCMKGTFERKTVTVKLLGADLMPVLTWNLMEAYPVKWSAPQLKADASAIAIHTLELAYTDMTIVPGEGRPAGPQKGVRTGY